MSTNELKQLRLHLVDLIIQARVLRKQNQNHPLHKQLLAMNLAKQHELKEKINQLSFYDNQFVEEQAVNYEFSKGDEINAI